MATPTSTRDPGGEARFLKPGNEIPALKGVWLSDRPVRSSVETLLLEMLEPLQPRPSLRRAVLEELSRPVKLTDVILDYLGLRPVAVDTSGDLPLLLVSPKPGRDAWQKALLRSGGDRPIGIVLNTRDRGRVALVHEVFAHFSTLLKHYTRRYAVLAAEGQRHEAIIEALRGELATSAPVAELLAEGRRHVQMLDPSVLFGPDGGIRVQLGSLSQTTRNLLREGLRGEQVFILPQTLFEAGTNYGDIEFLVYLNFFLRQGQRTRIAGTARQKLMFYRLLTLVIFGLFDPDAQKPASFDQLREAYRVPDGEAYRLFLTTYETYAVRRSPDAVSRRPSLDDYVDFVLLEPGETAIPIEEHGASGRGRLLGEVRVKSVPAGMFDVRIVSPDGRSTDKRMHVTAPGPTEVRIPEELRRPLEFATNRPQFGVTPLGTSHGFDPVGDVTSFVIWLNGRGILVDPSPEALIYLKQMGVATADVPYVFLTHIHADHDGGLLGKLLSGSRTSIIASDVVFRSFIEKAEIVTGHNCEREGLVRHVAANPGAPATVEIGGGLAIFETRWNLHPVPTNGFRMRFGGRTFGYSGDTQYDPAAIRGKRERDELSARQHDDLLYFFWTPEGESNVDLLYHEAGLAPIHTARETLGSLPEAVRARTFLVHIADADVPAGAVPAKPRLFSTHVLLPPTEQSRQRILVDTLRLVSYLYDIPTDTLEALLGGAEVRHYGRNDFVVRRGAVGRKEPLHFFVVADGEVAVREERRLITRLGKADTFGEWGISHQRGYRAADVVAVRACQCLQFTEAQYWWLVERHPVIQERIAQIRILLPRLELARARQRLQAGAGPLKPLRVVTQMTSSQLAGLALFGELKAFRKDQSVIVEGEEYDGSYVLLSGHLAASVGGWDLGELGEGDIFGEMGFLEGGRRQATIKVVSADAEMLFMSTRNFQRLLETFPAFSWGIHEMAAYRRESRRPVDAAPRV
jgi:CRP-like cAMP-binding protein